MKCAVAERPRTSTPRLPFDKFWKALELTWLYEPFFLSVRRYVFDSDSHRGKNSHSQDPRQCHTRFAGPHQAHCSPCCTTDWPA